MYVFFFRSNFGTELAKTVCKCSPSTSPGPESTGRALIAVQKSSVDNGAALSATGCWFQQDTILLQKENKSIIFTDSGDNTQIPWEAQVWNDIFPPV